MSNPHPVKPTAAQKYSLNNSLALKLKDIPIPEFKLWVPDPATLKAWDRASNPHRKEPGDGR